MYSRINSYNDRARDSGLQRLKETGLVKGKNDVYNFTSFKNKPNSLNMNFNSSNYNFCNEKSVKDKKKCEILKIKMSSENFSINGRACVSKSQNKSN